MSLFAFFTLLLSLVAFLMGIFTLVRNRKDPININWFLTNIAASIWSFSFFLVLVAPSYDVANMSQYFLDTSSIWVPIFFFHFVLAVLGKKNRFRVLYYASFALGAFISAFSLTPLFRNGMTSIAGFKYWVQPGDFYLLSPFVYMCFVIVSLFLLIFGLSKTRSVKKRQLKYILLAAIIGFGGAATNFFPQLFGIYPMGNYFIIVYIVLITYAIVKHRLMDVRLAVARSVAYVILLAILAIFYAGSVLAIERVFFANSADQINLTQGAVRTVLAVIMVFTFQPLRKWITKKTDRIFFKNAYDPQKLLDTLSHTMGSTIVLIELLYKVTDILIQETKVSRGLFVLLKDESELYTIQANGYRQNPKVEIEEIIHLAQNGTIVYDELQETSRYKSILRKYEAAVSLPLKTEKEIVGVFLVGEKNSGDMFNQQDLRILEIIAPEVSVAIENAKSYEEISRFNVTLRNEVKRATHRLKEKNQQLRELDKAKDEFISMASHQLRTPLTAIKGYLSMLLDGDAGEIKVGQYDFINEAYSGANRMVGLINDLLNVSRMETGRFFLEPEDLDIEQVIKEEVQQLTNTAKEKGIYLKMEKKGDIPKVWADETKIRQVIMNFIDNAIHYTTKGGVTVTFGKEKGYFAFSVKDSGIGVPKEQQKKLFEKFFRADNARHSRPDGTGLGLFLAKRVVEDHNGSIYFSSIEGQGSVFGFRLPLKKSDLIKPSTLENKPAQVAEANKVEAESEIEAETSGEDILTEQQQVPIPVDEPEHILKR